MRSSNFLFTAPFFAVLLMISRPAGAASAPAEVWISAQPVPLGGSGTAIDPYDGSTQPKFDALMNSFQNTPNLTIHLGAGTFRSDSTAFNRWAVRPGWTIEGAGMYQTTCQMMGNLAGKHGDYEFFKSPYNVSTDNVVIRDLTVDCNWAELSQTADVGANGEKFGAIFAVALAGSHILIDGVRHINSYGSFANENEPFGIGIGAPTTGDVTDDVIRNCRAELPQGNYGAPFALHGWVEAEGNGYHYITNSSAYGNYAAGRANGLATGFTTGGVNGAFIKNCAVHDNTFVDCQSIFYQDTGSIDGLSVTNNTLTNGWSGVTLSANIDPSWTKQNVVISGNQINVQNRTKDYGSAGYGVNIYGAASSKITIKNNHISFSPSGQGFPQFFTISAVIDNSDVFVNTADEASAGSGLWAPVRAQVNGYSTTIAGNKTSTGKTMTGLKDTYLAAMAKPLNFSTRATVGSGQNVLIDGFVITGSTQKKVLIRALGPSLGKSGISQTLSDPTLAVYSNDGSLLARNDDWKKGQQLAIQGTGLAPSNDAESALILTLSPGTYTTVMGGKSLTPGVGLIEVYDLTPTTDSSLQNVSTRGSVGTGENVIIGGFIVGDGQNPTMVVRGIGPSLSDAGIRNPLPDPIIELHDANGQLIAMNNNWKDTQQAAIEATGLAPAKDQESAIMQALPPGNYTTILKGNRNSSGVALVELYTLQ